VTVGIVPIAERRRSPRAVRQQLLAAIEAHPGISREELEARFTHVNRWTLRSAMKWLLHIDRLVYRDGAWSPQARYFPVEATSC
jgi:predicted transcriptional regulator